MDCDQKLKSLESRLDICQLRLDIISVKLDQLAERLRVPTMSEGERAVDTIYYKPAPRQKKVVFGEKELADLNSVDNLEIDNLWSQ
jgi:hypothetical protein